MPTDIVMPQMGESVVEGTISKWLKKPGDKVQRDEPLFEISTDKVDAEIPAPASGVLQEIKVPEGATVQVNTVVGTIAANGEPATATPSKPSSPENDSAATTETATPTSTPLVLQAELAREGRQARTVGEEDHDRISPLVHKIASKNNVSLSQVTGTGVGGRITKQDILTFIEKREAGTAPASAWPALTPSTGLTQMALIASPVAFPGQLVSMTQMRKIIAQRMIESRRTSAHVHCMFEVDLTRIVQLRNRCKAVQCHSAAPHQSRSLGPV